MVEEQNQTNKEAKQILSKTYGGKEPLLYHSVPTPGKFTIKTTKPMNNQKDLSLAYSPGVAAPCIAISKNPETGYLYTNKANNVAVVTNGTSVLGLGDLGALASKPCIEGKAVLFNHFAGVEAVDLCINADGVDEFVQCVKCLAPSFGAINLENIKAPDCFEIEEKLKEIMPIPVFHDDQHGTAVVCIASLINACLITQKNIMTVKIVVSGAGASGIAIIKLLKQYGVHPSNVICLDSHGVIYKGRQEGMTKHKEEIAVDTQARTLQQALNYADVYIGVSVEGSLKRHDIVNMNKDPIIFALANPSPEITPEEVKLVRPDAIVATSRSDYPNQINNVICFPYLFRAVLDTFATGISDQMLIAAVNSLADLARQPVPNEVSLAYDGKEFSFGKDYIIPTPFDPRLIYVVTRSVAQAAVESGMARSEIRNWDEYKFELRTRMLKTSY